MCAVTICNLALHAYQKLNFCCRQFSREKMTHLVPATVPFSFGAPQPAENVTVATLSSTRQQSSPCCRPPSSCVVRNHDWSSPVTLDITTERFLLKFLDNKPRKDAADQRKPPAGLKTFGPCGGADRHARPSPKLKKDATTTIHVDYRD